MREFRLRGSVRGAVGNDRPYRERTSAAPRISSEPGIASELLAIAQFWNKDGKIIRVSATQAVLSTEKSIIETHCDNAKR